MEDTKELKPSEPAGPTHIRAHRDLAAIKGQVSSPSTETGNGQKPPSNILSPTDSHLKMKTQFSPVGSHWGYKPL